MPEALLGGVSVVRSEKIEGWEKAGAEIEGNSSLPGSFAKW